MGEVSLSGSCGAVSDETSGEDQLTPYQVPEAKCLATVFHKPYQAVK